MARRDGTLGDGRTGAGGDGQLAEEPWSLERPIAREDGLPRGDGDGTGMVAGKGLESRGSRARLDERGSLVERG